MEVKYYALVIFIVACMVVVWILKKEFSGAYDEIEEDEKDNINTKP